jgi:hypothetical protein
MGLSTPFHLTSRWANGLLLRIALQSFLIAEWQMIRPVWQRRFLWRTKREVRVFKDTRSKDKKRSVFRKIRPGQSAISWKWLKGERTYREHPKSNRETRRTSGRASGVSSRHWGLSRPDYVGRCRRSFRFGPAPNGKASLRLAILGREKRAIHGCTGNPADWFSKCCCQGFNRGRSTTNAS